MNVTRMGREIPKDRCIICVGDKEPCRACALEKRVHRVEFALLILFCVVAAWGLAVFLPVWLSSGR
jgi:hypothetical protein